MPRRRSVMPDRDLTGEALSRPRYSHARNPPAGRLAVENGPCNPFEIRESEDDDGLLRLSVVGELDVATAPELQRRLTRARVARQAVRVDLSSLGFVYSSGIQALVAALLDG